MIVFLDESGNHNLDRTKLDNFYNLFVLGAVCFQEPAYEAFDRAFRTLKVKHFWSDDYIIHTQEITRPNKSKDARSKLFNDPVFRKAFYTDMNELIASSDFSVISCIVEKEKLMQEYVVPADPYHFSFENIINRLLRKSKWEKLDIFPEHRDNAEDRKLEIALLEMKVTGTRFYHGREVADKIRDFRLTGKQENLSGSQLADLLVTPIGRHLLSKVPRPDHEISYEIVKKKIQRHDDMTIFP